MPNSHPIIATAKATIEYHTALAKGPTKVAGDQLEQAMIAIMNLSGKRVNSDEMNNVLNDVLTLLTASLNNISEVYAQLMASAHELRSALNQHNARQN